MYFLVKGFIGIERGNQQTSFLLFFTGRSRSGSVKLRTRDRLIILDEVSFINQFIKFSV